MLSIATHLVAFWDGKSSGTKHMIEIAQAVATKKGKHEDTISTSTQPFPTTSQSTKIYNTNHNS